jgi:hypothetical protein
MPLDLVALTPMAASAVAYITPHVIAAGNKMLDAAAVAAGKKIVDAFTSLIGGSKAASAPSAQKALEELQKAPDDADYQDLLGKKLVKLLQEDAAVAEALQAWLKEHNVQPAGVVQTATASGANSTVNQVSSSSGVTIYR